MTSIHRNTVRSAPRAAWPLAFGIGGVAGKRVTGNGPAPI